MTSTSDRTVIELDAARAARSSPAVRPATWPELPKLATALARAFQDDPVLAWIVPDPDGRRRVLPEFFGLVADTLQPYGRVYRDGLGSAGALWVPPGRPVVQEDQAGAFAARAADIIGPDAERGAAISEVIDAHHPNQPHAYLWYLGVAPEARNRGLGANMLAPMLARCDRDGTPAYLEATSVRSRAFYQRHGFAVVDALSVPGGPPVWPMWREPARSPAP
ncbi:MAG: GNAT family N-acetyltransferase [Actinomycetes bacterium]